MVSTPSRPTSQSAWRLSVAIVATLLLMAVPFAASATAQEADGTELDPRARIVMVEPVIAPDGELWVRLHFEQPWEEMPPLDLFSIWFGIGSATTTGESWAGWEWHDGVSTPYESSASRGDSGAVALDDGTVLLATGLFPDSAVGLIVLMASWLHETESSRQGDQLEFAFQPEEFAHGDPLEMFGAPTYNLITASPIAQTTAPPSSVVEETPETPASAPEPTSSDEPESTQPVEDDSSDETAPPLVVESPTSATAETTDSTTSPETTGGGLSTTQKVALGTVLLFLIWMAYVYFSTRLVGVLPDPCASERAAVAAAKKALAEDEADEEAKSDARRKAEAARAEAEFSRSDRRRVIGRADMEVDNASTAEDRAKTRTTQARNALLAAEAALARCEKRAEATSGDETTSEPPPTSPTAPDGSATESPPESECCPSGNWIGINIFSGGILFVGGIEWGLIYLVCIDNPDRTAVVSWRGARGGLGLGAEISGGLFLILGGPKHPKELEKSVESILSGADFDLSLGASWTKLAKAGVKAGRNVKTLKTAVEGVRDASKALDKARKAGNIGEATRISAMNADVLRQLVRDGTAGKLVDELAEVSTKTGLSGAQTQGSGVNIPLGAGLQAGVWYTGWVNAMLQSWDGCEECGSY